MPTGFDFDEWARLARADPTTFNHRRREAVEEIIRAAPAERRPRLRSLQWRLDRLRQTASSPLSACVRIYDLMWESFSGEHGLAASLADPYRRTRRPRCPVVILKPRR